MTTSTYLTFSGFYHLIGQQVSAFIGGLDCGDYGVDTTGTVTVPFGSDDGGLMTPAYLARLAGATGENATTVYFDAGNGGGVLPYVVPVVIGVGYTSNGQTLRPATAEDLRSPSGPALAKMRRAYQFGALLLDAVKISFGADFGTTLQPASFRTVYTDPASVEAETTMYSGVYWGDIANGTDFDNAISWQITRPVPATVCALTAFLEGEER